MKASIVDLRYKMSEVLKALDRNESVTVLYHGHEKAEIRPIQHGKESMAVKDHAFFSMYGDDKTGVDEVMEELRGPRYGLD